MTETNSRIRRFRNKKWQFELYQGNYGNQRESYIIVTPIGPRGGLKKPFVPNWLDASGLDYDEAREILAERVARILDGELGPYGF
jgi:hypothetical protein